MKRIFCDRCGVEIFPNSLQPTRFPMIRISALYDGGKSRMLDICEACQEYFCIQFKLLLREGNENI